MGIKQSGKMNAASARDESESGGKRAKSSEETGKPGGEGAKVSECKKVAEWRRM